jgi:hypothetical protein
MPGWQAVVLPPWGRGSKWSVNHSAYVAYSVTDMKAEFVDDTGKTQQVDE